MLLFSSELLSLFFLSFLWFSPFSLEGCFSISRSFSLGEGGGFFRGEGVGGAGEEEEEEGEEEEGDDIDEEEPEKWGEEEGL